MRTAYWKILSVVLICLFAAVAGYEHLRYREMAASSAPTVRTVIWSLGELAGVVAALDGRGADSEKAIRQSLRGAVTGLALVVATEKIEVEHMDNNTLTALCRLVADAPRLFPQQSVAGLEGVVNPFLNRQLHKLEEPLRTVSAARNRGGVKHECALLQTGVAP